MGPVGWRAAAPLIPPVTLAAAAARAVRSSVGCVAAVWTLAVRKAVSASLSRGVSLVMAANSFRSSSALFTVAAAATAPWAGEGMANSRAVNFLVMVPRFDAFRQGALKRQGTSRPLEVFLSFGG